MIISFRDGDLEFIIFIRKDVFVMCRVMYFEFKIKDIEKYILLEKVENFFKIRGYLLEKGFYKL